jgi:protein ImuB
MGQDAKRLRHLACGEMPHLFQPVETPSLLEERIELDSPVEQMDSLLFAAGVLLDKVLARARARILALASLTITLNVEGGGTHQRTIRPALPGLDKQFWIKLLHLDLDAHPPQAAVVEITLTAEPGSTNKVQLGLFSPQLPEASRLDVTLARLRAILGPENVGQIVLEDSHAPEAFHLEPFTVPTGHSIATQARQTRASLRQLRPRETVSVRIQNERPILFYWRQQRYEVQKAYGPWQMSGDWWRQSLWGIEQWDLIARGQDSAMLCCLLVHDLMQNLWQMAALYD